MIVIFLNKIIFLPQVKDSLLLTNLCQENLSRAASSVSSEDGSLYPGDNEATGGAERETSSEELDLQEADLHDNHHHGSSVVPASTLNQMQYNF